jgi:hypothetical protein
MAKQIDFEAISKIKELFSTDESPEETSARLQREERISKHKHIREWVLLAFFGVIIGGAFFYSMAAMWILPSEDKVWFRTVFMSIISGAISFLAGKKLGEGGGDD